MVIRSNSISNLQSTATGRLDNKDGLKRDTWISLGRGDGWYLLGKLEVGWGWGDEGMRKQIGQAGYGKLVGIGLTGRVMKKTSWWRALQSWGESWYQGNSQECTRITPDKILKIIFIWNNLYSKYSINSYILIIWDFCPWVI